MNILERHHTNAAFVKLEDITPAITKEELLSLRSLMKQVFIDRTLLQYIALIVQQTRTSKAVYWGLLHVRPWQVADFGRLMRFAWDVIL